MIQILKETGCVAHSPTSTALEGAIRLLSADDSENPWHHDGWLFQVISWIAANIQDDQSLKSPPHMIHAHKGFDGLQLSLDQDKETVVAVVICEEKATSNPRNKITGEVWRDFRLLETGARDNELVAKE